MPVISNPTAIPKNFSSLTADDFVKKSGAFGDSGRIEILETETGRPELMLARRTFKDRVLSCLAKIPEFKDMNMVKSYIKKTTISNQISLGKFFTALATSYSKEAGLRAFEEILLKKKNITLDQCTVRQLNATAEKYHGLGEAKLHSRQVVLNIWDYTSMDHCGHASLTLNNHDAGKTIHSSWCPARDAADAVGKDPTGSAFRARLFEKRPANNVESYEIDQRFEMKKVPARSFNAALKQEKSSKIA